MARPRKYDQEEIENIKAEFEQYIESTEIPIVAEFAYKHEIYRQSLYDYEEFSTLLKRCIDKKEAQLERKALNGKINTTMAIFSLKQIGWKDKQEVEHSGTLQTKLVIDEVLDE